jgi:hypothetical protein
VHVGEIAIAALLMLCWMVAFCDILKIPINSNINWIDIKQLSKQLN